MARASREHLIQCSIVQWSMRARLKSGRAIGNYKFVADALVASGNGLHTSKAQGSKFKASGAKAGFPDLQLCIPVNGYHGLFIELKCDATRSSKKGTTQANQIKVISDLNAVGYLAVICYGYDQSVHTIKMYLGGEADLIQDYLYRLNK